MSRSVWIVNDLKTCIEGSRTLWHDLLDWIPGAVWASCGSYDGLVRYVSDSYGAALHKPEVIIRNASYFGRLEVDCPTISLLQDIFHVPHIFGSTPSSIIAMPLKNEARALQVEVCRNSEVIVVPSPYVISRYPELPREKIRVIPLPVDFDLFKPDATIPKTYDVCWIGADSEVKGYDTLLSIIGHNPGLRFLVIRKDLPGGCNTSPFANMETWGRMSQGHLATSINRCRVGLCTSREETQHLAGIEMGACGLPVIATNVGIYWNRPTGAWGTVIHRGIWREAIDAWIDDSEDGMSRVYWQEIASREACRASWLEVIDGLA